MVASKLSMETVHSKPLSKFKGRFLRHFETTRSKRLWTIVIVTMLDIFTQNILADEIPSQEFKQELRTETSDEGAPPVSVEAEKKPDPQPILPPADKVPRALLRMSEHTAFSPYAFIVDKSQKTLSVWRQNDQRLQFVTAYPVDTGRISGNKNSVGDHKTPEGIYFFQDMHDGRKLNYDEYGSVIFTMDYPNLFDRIQKKTGYGIWLHAVPNSKSLWRGSRGCVVVRDNVIKLLKNFITLKKTPIIVENQVQYVDPNAEKANMQQWTQWLENWRKSWESKNIDSYMTFYGDQFESLGMNKRKWQEYKSGLNQKYSSIRVQIQEPSVYVHGDTIVVRFLQSYASNMNADFGEKTLYVNRSGDQFKIVGESWRGIGNSQAALPTAGAGKSSGGAASTTLTTQPSVSSM